MNYEGGAIWNLKVEVGGGEGYVEYMGDSLHFLLCEYDRRRCDSHTYMNVDHCT